MRKRVAGGRAETVIIRGCRLSQFGDLIKGYKEKKNQKGEKKKKLKGEKGGGGGKGNWEREKCERAYVKCPVIV